MNRFLALLISILSAAIILIHCSAEKTVVRNPEERCELPVWNAGDYWKYQLSDKRWWSDKVIGVGKDIYIVESGNERKAIDSKTLRFKMWVDIQWKRVPSRSGEGSLFYDFPLYVGKKWGKMVEGQLFSGAAVDYLFSFRVLSFEEVKVAAGTFKAFKIQVEQKSLQSGGVATTHIWFSPEIKNLVKLEFIDSYGAWSVKRQDFELADYRLAVNYK